jgi:hypothetical protein
VAGTPQLKTCANGTTRVRPTNSLAQFHRLRHDGAPMSYSLSFSEEFFVRDDPERIEPSARPTTVYQAILSLLEDTWREMAREVFSLAADQLAPESVLAKILETNTCSNLEEPVEVWIDPDGIYSLRVYSPAPPSPLAAQEPSS